MAYNKHIYTILKQTSKLISYPKMRGDLIASFSKIDFSHSVTVNWISFIWIYHNHKQARVGVNHLWLITTFQVPENRSIIEKSQIDHVFAFLKFRRIDFAYLHCFMSKFLVGNPNHTFRGRVFQITTFQKTLPISSSFWTRNPDWSFRIIWFVTVRPPGFWGGHQVLGWIRIHLSSLGQLDVTRHLPQTTSLLRSLMKTDTFQIELLSKLILNSILGNKEEGDGDKHWCVLSKQHNPAHYKTFG